VEVTGGKINRMLAMDLKYSVFTDYVIGERRHYQGCTNSRNCICVYILYIWTYVKHNSSMGTY